MAENDLNMNYYLLGNKTQHIIDKIKKNIQSWRTVGIKSPTFLESNSHLERKRIQTESEIRKRGDNEIFVNKKGRRSGNRIEARDDKMDC